MALNYLRRVEVALAGSAGSRVIKGGGDKDLRIVFATEQWHSQTPNKATIRIYNPSTSTIGIFKNKEFTDITLSAGYEQGNFGMIFQGNIVQTIDGHENATDTYIDIFAYDGDTAYKKSILSSTLMRGYTPKDMVNLAVQSMSQYGVTYGGTNLDLSQPVYPRGAPFIGMAYSVLRQVALSQGALWSIQDGKIHLVDLRKPYDFGSDVTLTAQTGLVGWPKQTAAGVETISLINPSMRPFTKITLDPSQM